MNKSIAVLPGDGIGPEVLHEARKVLDAIAFKFNHRFAYQFCSIGAEAIEHFNTPLPEKTLQVCLSADAVLFGAIGHPRFDNDPFAAIRPEQGLLSLRKSLGLYANIRPVTTYAALHHLSPLKSSRLKDVDFIIYRELTGGIYFGEKNLTDDKVQASDLCVYSRHEIERICHLAFKAAHSRNNKLTLVDKANVLETSRLWRSVVQELSPAYPSVQVDYMYVDNAAMQIIMNPGQFDVILTENMFGDILSDEASMLTGSLGLLPSASIGDKTALFEPIHGSYPQATGKGIASPIGAVLSAAMMLDYFELSDEAAIIRNAVQFTLEAGFVTKDIDPINFYFTETIGDMICDYIQNGASTINRENIRHRKSTLI